MQIDKGCNETGLIKNFQFSTTAKTIAPFNRIAILSVFNFFIPIILTALTARSELVVYLNLNIFKIQSM